MELLLENFLKNENLNSQTFGDLILFDYNRTVSYDRLWNEPTNVEGRGIAFDKVTGQVVCLPLPKFWNYEEPECQEKIKDLPKDTSFHVYEKYDGSNGQLFFYNGKWNVKTRGSFTSDQAVWGQKWLEKNIKLDLMNPDYTYITEILFKSNRIVIDYGDYEGMVLLACRNRVTGDELSYDELVLEGAKVGFDVAKKYDFKSFEEMFNARLILTGNQEGWVIHYPHNNFRFKLKGAAYCSLHKIVSNINPLAFWEAFDVDALEIPKAFLECIPEEFRETSDKIKEVLEKAHKDAYIAIIAAATLCPDWMFNEELDKDQNKERWFYLVERFGNEAGTILSYLKGQFFRIKVSIHKDVRPTANILPGVDLSRVNRVIEDV